MHQDYFKLLANLPYDHNVIAPPGSDGLPSDIFNQGYFERFFRKIPPGILGSGAHAQVFKVMHVLKNIQLGIYAVKRINVGDHSQFLDQVLNEVLILYELSAKGANENNLIRYNHVWMELGDMKDLTTIYLNNEGLASSENEKIPYVYILQQYCDGGHLENLIVDNFQIERFMSAKERLEAERQKRRNSKHHHERPEPEKRKAWLSDFEIWKFFRDIVNGVSYLHSKGILHRDLKPSNCLLETKYNWNTLTTEKFSTISELEEFLQKLPKVLVSDFGEGKFIDKQHVADLTLQVDDERRGNTGTIEFTDPKLWIYAHYDGKQEGNKFAFNFTKASDIYSLGIILCYLCVGELPFTEKISDRTDPERIRSDIARWHDTLTSNTFHEWFTKKILEVRGSLTQCLHDFEYLVYLMIKSENKETSPSSTFVLEYLDSMKHSSFIGEDRKLSEATITEVPKVSADGDDADSLLEEDTINLTDFSIHQPEQAHEGSYIDYFVITPLKRNIVVATAYISSLAVLEILCLRDSRLVRVVKLVNIAGLSGEVVTGGSPVQTYICELCVFLTLYVFQLGIWRT